MPIALGGRQLRHHPDSGRGADPLSLCRYSTGLLDVPGSIAPETLRKIFFQKRNIRMAVAISGLSKTYPNGVKALKSISLNIGNNMFGLVGPNGAGKSTLMRTIATLQDPDSGSVQLDGLNVLTEKNEVRKVLGYLPQEFGVYPKMSALDLLQHLAVMKGITSSSERKEMVDALLQQTAMRLLCASTTTSRLASLTARGASPDS